MKVRSMLMVLVSLDLVLAAYYHIFDFCLSSGSLIINRDFKFLNLCQIITQYFWNFEGILMGFVRTLSEISTNWASDLDTDRQLFMKYLKLSQSDTFEKCY
jgi:hypothetical protein